MKKLILLTLSLSLRMLCWNVNELERTANLAGTRALHIIVFRLIWMLLRVWSQMPITVEVQNGEIISITYPDGTLASEDRSRL